MADQSIRAPQVGAVAYLNMLPYFFGDEGVVLYRTPQELNGALAAGEVDAGCSSVVAGFELGLEPLWPMAGVAAEAGVRSVYVEPVVVSEAERLLWENVRAALSAPRSQDHAADAGLGLAWSQAKISEVQLLTTGASAQSLWLCENLFSAIGLHTRVMRVDPSLLQWSPQSIATSLGPAAESQLRCILAIGDPALKRLYLYPESEHVPLRFDVGELWRDHTGLPCLFALWFARKNLSEPFRRALCERLRVGLSRWNGLTQEQRRDAALAFLERSEADARGPSGQTESQPPGLGQIMGHSALADYLACLCFDLSAPAFAASFRCMSQIFSSAGTTVAGLDLGSADACGEGVLAAAVSAERRREGARADAQS